MNFNKFLQSLFGNKSSRDMKLIQPLVEEVKKAYPEIKALSNDELRARTKQLQQYVQDSAKEQKAKIEELKAKIEDTPIDERETIFNAIPWTRYPSPAERQFFPPAWNRRCPPRSWRRWE